jgi:GNAT superfamily N-acetyltransferase
MVTLRQFQPDDLKALYAISLMTGHLGGDASRLYSDPSLLGHIYAAPYAHIEPSLALVVVDDDGVAGFAVGTLDTVAWQDALELNWWPKLRSQYDDPGGLQTLFTADERRAFMIHHPERTPPSVAEAYPAHLHANLLPRVQGRGVGLRLVEAWLDLAAVHGGGPTHVGVNRENLRAVKFWGQRGFGELRVSAESVGRTVWMGRPIKGTGSPPHLASQ